MAAFSYQQVPFLVDSASSYFTNNTSLIKNNMSSTSSSSSSLEKQQVLCVVQSPESSMAVDNLEKGEQVTQKKKKRIRNKSSLCGSPLSKDSKEGMRRKRLKKSSGDEGMKGEEKKKIEVAPTGFIHVRARRGQATDIHSLAERVRREKISERMKILQELVPGCDRVTGKALVLDEIINYVQSLQNQVEFLSMKLASVNPILFDFSMDLDTHFVRPDQQRLNNGITSPSSTPLPFADTIATSFHHAHNDYVLDHPIQGFLQGQRSNTFIEHTDGPFWDIEDQRQKLLNPYGLGNNTCSLN